MDTIEALEDGRCTGCYGCYNICPSKAIIKTSDDFGFFYPKIDNDLCIRCGLCFKTCPVLSPNLSNDVDAIYYAAWSTDDSVRLTSSSGGVFSEIAAFYLNKGIVYGAQFDENLNVQHMGVRDKEELEKIRGSKYIQSDIDNKYSQALELALKGNKILFSGTPCQVSAIKNLFALNETESQLFTVDLICHGVVSKKIFTEYIDWMEEKTGKKIKGINFRDKSTSWDKYNIKISFVDGTDYLIFHLDDVFMLGYLRNYFVRKSCIDCEFNKVPRGSDITLGDYWNVPLSLYDKRGVSIVLANTDKGKELLSKINKIQKIKGKEENFLNANSRLKLGKLVRPKDYDDFMVHYFDGDFSKIVNKYLRPDSGLSLLLNKIWSVIKRRKKKLRYIFR